MQAYETTPASRSGAAEKLWRFDCEPLNVWTPFCTTTEDHRGWEEEVKKIMQGKQHRRKWPDFRPANPSFTLKTRDRTHFYK